MCRRVKLPTYPLPTLNQPKQAPNYCQGKRKSKKASSIILDIASVETEACQDKSRGQGTPSKLSGCSTLPYKVESIAQDTSKGCKGRSTLHTSPCSSTESSKPDLQLCRMRAEGFVSRARACQRCHIASHVLLPIATLARISIDMVGDLQSYSLASFAGSSIMLRQL